VSIRRYIIAFNSRLQKILKPHKHASLINLPMDRDHFTKHGLHMNGSGKDRLSGLLTSKISEIFATQPSVIPISIPWKDEATVAEVELKRPNGQIRKTLRSHVLFSNQQSAIILVQQLESHSDTRNHPDHSQTIFYGNTPQSRLPLTGH
jgi:hypothetical protein